METIEPRVMKLEGNHRALESNQKLLTVELSQMNKTLSKIETSIEKQNEISADIRLLSLKYENHIENDTVSRSRIHKRLDMVEGNQSKVAWFIIALFITAVGTLVLKGH